MIVSCAEPAIDAGIGADLHVIFHDHPAQLRHREIAARGGGGIEAETVLAEPGAGEDGDPFADDRMRQADMRADPAICTDHHPGADHRQRADAGAGADRNTGFDHRAGTDFRRDIDLRARCNDRRWMHARLHRRQRIETIRPPAPSHDTGWR